LQAGARRYDDLSHEECMLLDEATADVLCSPSARPTRPRAKSRLPPSTIGPREHSEHNHQTPDAFWWL
jgi:hypothetical protein